MPPATQTVATDLPQDPHVLLNGPAETRSALLIGMGRTSPPFVAALEAAGVAVTASHGSGSAVALAARLRPELLLVGPDATPDPEEIIALLREVPGIGRILVLLPSADPTLALNVVEQGADDVVPPPHSVSSVLLRAHLLASRQWAPWGTSRPAGPSSAGFGVVHIDPESRRIENSDEDSSLTGREFQLLERLVAAGGSVVDRTTLLDDIWGDAARTEAVLDATVHRLRRKLEHNPANPGILTTVRGVGYRLDVERIHFTRPLSTVAAQPSPN